MGVRLLCARPSPGPDRAGGGGLEGDCGGTAGGTRMPACRCLGRGDWEARGRRTEGFFSGRSASAQGSAGPGDSRLVQWEWNGARGLPFGRENSIKINGFQRAPVLVTSLTRSMMPIESFDWTASGSKPILQTRWQQQLQWSLNQLKFRFYTRSVAS